MTVPSFDGEATRCRRCADRVEADVGGFEPLLYKLGRAGKLVEEAERDLENAQRAMRDARYDFGGDVDLAGGRYLDPERRERFAEYTAAEAGVAAAVAALHAAKRVQSELLAKYDLSYAAYQLGRTPDIV